MQPPLFQYRGDGRNPHRKLEPQDHRKGYRLYAAIPDLRTEYQRGQELDCIVKEYDRRRGMLMVSVKETEPNPFDGAEMRHPEDSRRQAVIAGK